MKNIWHVMKKELLRVLKDPKLILMLILPGILIFVIYNFMGDMMTDQYAEDPEMQYSIVAVNLTNADEVEDIIEALNEQGEELFKFSFSQETDLAAQMELLHTGAVHIVINADLGILTVYYNPNMTNSTYAYAYVQTAFMLDSGVIFYPSEEVDATSIVTQLVPFLLLTFLFSGCMGVAPDAIAGEKERGTISTILITPIKRGELALGKVLALGVLAIISATASFLGLMFSLPALLGTAAGAVSFKFSQYLLIFLVVVSTVLLIIGVMAIISAFAKTVKEANMLLMPFMFLSMLVGLLTMVNGAAATSFAVYFIPLYNTVQAVTSILTFTINPMNLIITFVANLVYLAAAVFVLTKMFNNEKIMFKK